MPPIHDQAHTEISGFMPVTIIIPVLNREVLVERCLASVEAQDMRPLKVVLVDNGSTDSTPEKLKNWARRVSKSGIECEVTVERVPGAANARNAGLNLVETPWVMFFDSDDTLRPDHLSRLTEAIRRRPDADLIGWGTLLHMPGGQIRRKKFPTRQLWQNTLFGGKMSTQSYAATTALMQKAGAWDPALRCWDDIELASRLLVLNPRIAILDDQWVDIYPSDDSITGPDFTSRADECLLALERMRHSYPAPITRDIDLKKAILAGRMTFEGSPRGDGLFMDMLAKASGRRHRLALRIAYAYVSRGYRGIARLFHPFM